VKLGLFGGSFDPIHRGHVEAGRSALEEADLDRVLFLPTADPPHKPPRVASAWARLVMVELALLDEKGLYVSAHELTPGRTAYTVGTLEHFRDLWPEAELHLVVGSDSLARLHTWRRWRDLVRLARLVVQRRPGWGPDEVQREVPEELAAVLEEGEEAASRYREGLPAPIWIGRPTEVSSTALREAFHRGERPSEELLPPRVLDYIQKYDLYR
jgi:nicotinate-nucleotide adenylyltransferase